MTPLGTAAARMLVPVSSGRCLQIGPLDLPRQVGVLAIDVAGDVVECVNLAMYGWADRHVFAGSQELASATRRIAKARPKDVSRPPSEYRQYLLIDREPGHDSLADAHRRVGRNPYITYEGEEHDYVIVRDDRNQAADALRGLLISKARAQRRTGQTQLRSGNRIIRPDQVTRPPRLRRAMRRPPSSASSLTA